MFCLNSTSAASSTKTPDVNWMSSAGNDTLVATVQLIGGTLYASPDSLLYQWIDCSANVPIAGANSQTYTTAQNGSYAVIAVASATCYDTSTCVSLNNISISELDGERSIKVYPNPSQGVFLLKGIHKGNYSIYTTNGSLILTEPISSGGTPIDLSHKAKGLYFLAIEDMHQRREVFRLIKE